MLINFAHPLIKATLVKRYKRFFADAILESGEEVTAHCPNTGSMKTCGAPGDTIYLLHQPSPTRKLAYTWELTQVAQGFVGVHTARPNQLIKAAIGQGLLPALSGYQDLKSEVKYGKDSRIDLLLSDPIKGSCYVEIKNTTLLQDSLILFPDAVTSRGLKHLGELEQQVKEGHRAVMFYLVNRPEGEKFAPADHIDPAYAKGFKHALAHGVEVLAYRAHHSLLGINLGKPVEVLNLG